MKSSQAGYGDLTDGKINSIAQTSRVNSQGWVFNSIGQSRQVEATIEDIIRPDYVPRKPEMHIPRPDSRIDPTLPVYR